MRSTSATTATQPAVSRAGSFSSGTGSPAPTTPSTPPLSSRCDASRPARASRPRGSPTTRRSSDWGSTRRSCVLRPRARRTMRFGWAAPATGPAVSSSASCSSATGSPGRTVRSTSPRVNALRNFQYRSGLQDDGIAGQRTLHAAGHLRPEPAAGDRAARQLGERTPDRLLAGVAADLGGRRKRRGRQDASRLGPALRAVRRDVPGLLPVAVHELDGRPVDPLALHGAVRVRPAGRPDRVPRDPEPERASAAAKEQLGLPLSGGCVRQSTADAQWVWNWAYIGTVVVVL